MTHEERVHHHMYSTCEGIAEHAERIVRLEEMCQKLWAALIDAYVIGTTRQHEHLTDLLDKYEELLYELDVEVDA